VDSAEGLRLLFRPRSIAVIGASRDPDSISGRLWRNLADSFRGPLYPVNPRADTIGEHRAYDSVLSIPGPIDLVFVATPARFVLDAIRECAEKGAGAVVLITAGFAETDEAGRSREAELKDIIRSSGMRVIGPNCFGVMNTDPDSGFNGTFSPAPPPCGGVAVCTQSGALGVAVPGFLRDCGLGISCMVSMGNKADLTENELLPWWEQDPATSVILLYLESFHNPRKLLPIAQRIVRRKPIVALKAGRSEAGFRAAKSHTAALASSAAATEAFFKQSGMVGVHSLQELVETTSLFASGTFPAGPRVAILTNAGGPGVLCADALEACGLTAPEFSAQLQQSLRRRLRPEAATGNPVDLVASVDPAEYTHCLELLLASEEIDAIIAIYLPRVSGTSGAVAAAMREAVQTARRRIPVLSVFVQPEPPPRELSQDGIRIPAFRYPESAAKAVPAAVQYAQQRQRPEGRRPHFDDIRTGEVRKIVERALDQLGSDGGWLDPGHVQQLLIAAGFSVPLWEIAEGPEQVVAAARRFGCSVALKAIAPDLIHKSAAGAIALDLQGDDAVRGAFHRLRASITDCRRVFVQQFIRGGSEFLIGAARDAIFGPLIAFGAGGTGVEIMQDIAFCLHPLTDRDAADLIHQTRIGRLVEDTPEKSPLAAAMAESILRVSALLSTAPEITELDLNPVKAIASPHSITVLDARVRLIFHAVT
jgi:acetate---CoA ligase (ADP-forming)